MHPLLRHTLGSLTFGFLLIFAFALFVQITADLVNWIFGMQVRFLFPRGLIYMFEDHQNLLRVLTSLAFTSVVVAAIFFVVKLRRREGIFDWADEPPQDD